MLAVRSHPDQVDGHRLPPLRGVPAGPPLVDLELRIAYDRLAGDGGEPLLLVMGLAVSRFWWPAGLCQMFAERGFAVARYDQRDAGQSARMPDTGGSNPFAALARKRSPYTSEDMTDDAVTVMDALGWDRAHIFGASLGGIIAQHIALRHPDRVLSVVSAMGMPSDVSGIGGGRLVILPGAGHDLPGPLWPLIAGEVRRNADRSRP